MTPDAIKLVVLILTALGIILLACAVFIILFLRPTNRPLSSSETAFLAAMLLGGVALVFAARYLSVWLERYNTGARRSGTGE